MSKPASHPDCRMPPRAKGSPPGFKELPERMIGCRLAAHGNSSPSKAGRTALSMHASVASKTTLFNVGAPVVFKNAELRIDQRAGYEGAKWEHQPPQYGWQLISWPRKQGCATDDDCKKDAQGKLRPDHEKRRCRVLSKKKSFCESKRRKKTPFAYVVGDVYPDDGIVRATPVALFPGRVEPDGSWVPAKYFNPATCKEADKALCPAITTANTVRFVPNPAEDKYPQPFSVTLDGARRRRRSRR